MRHLSEKEMMALRIALQLEREKLAQFVESTRDPYEKASYSERLKTVEVLLIEFAAGKKVVLPDAEPVVAGECATPS